MEVVTEVALGKGDVSLAALGKFCGRTYELIDQVWRSDRSNPPERQQAKQDFVELMRDHTWIVTIACIAYTLFVHFGPALIRRPWPVKGVLAAWNLALAVFSAFGAWHCLSGLVTNMAAQGWRYTVCTQPKMIDLAGTDLDVWACFFVLSKIFEFFDTVLKIVLQKQFIFLHWYHHLATAWLCWISLAYDFAPGTWIAAVNYSVHAPMYTYYFASSVLNKKWFTRLCKPVAPFITTFQTTQMAMFTVVNCSAVYYLYFEEPRAPCSITPFNLYANAAVVLSYFVLFALLFVDKYIRRSPSDCCDVQLPEELSAQLSMKAKGKEKGKGGKAKKAD